MFPWAPVAGFASSIAGGLFDLFGANKANKQAQQLAREQMEFQERMSNTAYQRSVQDMRKAGLNPVMAAFKGGASTPSGAMAPVVNELSGMGNSARELGKTFTNLSFDKARIERDILKEKLIQEKANSAEALVRKAGYEAARGPVENLISGAKDILRFDLGGPTQVPPSVLDLSSELKSSTAAAVKDAEKRLGRPLEDPYREFLRLFGTTPPQNVTTRSSTPKEASEEDKARAKARLRRKLRERMPAIQ